MVDLVLCTHSPNPDHGKRFLFYAPPHSGIRSGDAVTVDTIHGEQPATVVAVFTTVAGNDAYRMIVQTSGATGELKKVISKTSKEYLDYSEMENPNNADILNTDMLFEEGVPFPETDWDDEPLPFE